MEVAQDVTVGADPRRAATHLRELAMGLLPRMYRPQQKLFAFRLRKTPQGVMQEGISLRYTATVLIGLATEPPAVDAQVLAGQDRMDVCAALLDRLETMGDPGEAALTLWATRALNHPRADEALQRVGAMALDRQPGTTVEAAWALSALSVPSPCPTDHALAGRLAQRLMATFRPQSGLFAHWIDGTPLPWLRGHVACFADLVYPTQALSHHARAAGDEQALRIARACAARMVELQGPAGQWWWHYDIRTGRVVEGYPVYSVHQDSMAPMALETARLAGGDDHRLAIARGLSWLYRAPETGGSLIEADTGIIWRKVGRREPRKLSRGMQAFASRLVPPARVPLGAVLRPGAVDYESRPYHMGWILHAWPASPAKAD